MGLGAKWVVGVTGASIVSLMVVITLVIGSVDGDGGAGAQGLSSATQGGNLKNGIPEIPKQYVQLIKDAVAQHGCPALSESVLAAQVHQESGFNPNAQSAAGAQGIAQFMPATWEAKGLDGDGDGAKNVFDPADAIPSAAAYDCELAQDVSAIPGDPTPLMLAAYNAGVGRVKAAAGVPLIPETQIYVNSIIALAKKWSVPIEIGQSGKIQLTGNKIIDTAVQWAASIAREADTSRKSMYQFGGDCTDPFGSVLAHLCDCSSFTQQAYAQAGVGLPRTAAEQSRVGTEVLRLNGGKITDWSRLQPGDLVVSIGSDGSVSRPGHIAIYVGNGNVAEAPYDGVPVHFFPVSGYHDVVTVRRIVNLQTSTPTNRI